MNFIEKHKGQTSCLNTLRARVQYIRTLKLA